MSISRWVIGDSGARRGPPNSRSKAGRGHLQPFAIPEIGHVHPEGAVRFEVDQMVSDQICVNGRPVRGQSHQLVLAGVDPEPRVVGEGGIEQPQRVRKP